MYGNPVAAVQMPHMQKRAQQTRLNAAKRALKIAHRLPVGDQKARHMSRIFSNMNRIRAGLSLVGHVKRKNPIKGFLLSRVDLSEVTYADLVITKP